MTRHGGGLGSASDDGKANILVVDDKPENVMTLEAILEDLGQNVISASSGKDALRCVLQHEFAVIFLDVNMPGMDGFETAQMIRQRKSCESTPIIFITAFGDELHTTRGYSLGAVDCILSPVVPDVLRTKASVFVELYKKTRQVSRQASRLEERAEQLHRLTRASMAINSALSMEDLLRVVTDTAREIVGADLSSSMITGLDGDASRALRVWSKSEKFPDRGTSIAKPDVASISALSRFLQSPMRVARGATNGEAQPRGPSANGSTSHPVDGWVAVPLTGRDSRGFGMIQVSEKRAGDFTADDEAVLVQLAQMAAIAIENTVNAEAREANRLKDEFLSTLSHELRTPLHAIMGWTQLLSTKELPEADVTHGLEVIERNVRAQSKLIEDLLDISRITSGKMRLSLTQVSLRAVTQSTIEAFRLAAQAKELTLNHDFSATTETLAADPDRLQQVLGNLVGNAIKFTPRLGRIDVRVECADNHFEIRVSDTGQGIAPEFLPFVFERFRQGESSTTRSHGGLGIGLALARHIVGLHGGTIRAASDGENRGATFVVRLPIVPARTEPLDPSRAPSLASARIQSLEGLRVLIVDDEKDTLELLSRVLRHAKADVTAVTSARNAIATLDREAVDVLVSDIAMPEEDGYSLIGRVRKREPAQKGRIPAIALTAFAREEDRRGAIAAGFQVHLAKPVDPAVLVSTVAQLAGR